MTTANTKPTKQSKTEGPTKKQVFENHYICDCGEEWYDVWDCTCNDHCPTCDKEIEPTESTELDA